ncbi:MAG TPA: hypothetical protein VGB77_02750 [Abditibacteriaceae bacterium]|jgi:hypothetical protein
MESEIIGRLPRYNWLLVFFVAGIGLMGASCPFPRPLTGADFWIWSAIVAFPLGLALAYGLLVCRQCVVVNETGLRWRGIGRWKSATWPQVRDFYIRPLPQGKRNFVVETELGKLTLDNLQRRALLQEAIEQRAKWTQVQEWKERPRQSLELTAPEVFEANRGEVRFYPWMVALVTLLMPLQVFAGAIGKPGGMTRIITSITQQWTQLGPLWTVAFGLLLLVMCALYPAIVLATGPRIRAMKERMEQRITASPEGLIWQDGTREIRARWDEVTSYYVDTVPGWVTLSARCVVETRRGDFDWVGVKNGVRLMNLVKHHAALGPWKRKEPVKREAFEVSTSGAHVFTYRTREVRALMLLMTFMALACCISAFVNAVGWNPRANTKADAIFGIGLAVFCVIGCLWAWLQYWRFEIRTDVSGLHAQSWCRKNFLAWPQVREYEINDGFFVVRAMNGTIRFYGLLDRVEELKGEIQERSINSLNRNW